MKIISNLRVIQNDHIGVNTFNQRRQNYDWKNKCNWDDTIIINTVFQLEKIVRQYLLNK